MSEEEKEAINNVDKFVDTILVILPKYSTKIPEYCIKEEDWLSIKQVLNYIDKLQKELDNSISKDIIRDKIKELGSIKGDLATYIAVTEKMKILNELLGGD